MFNQAKENPADQNQTPTSPRSVVHKYDGTRRLSRQTHYWYKRKADIWISPTDPDATPLRPDLESRAKLSYHDHYVVDGGKARIILAALVTPASVMDNTPMLDLAPWTRFRWQLNPTIAVADAKYGTIINIVGLEQDHVRAYIPTSDFSERTDFYPTELFQYDTAHNLFVCPQGQELLLYKRSYTENEFVYRADRHICNACPVKTACTNSKSGRHLRRSFFQEDLDRAQSYRVTEAYKKAMRKRQVWVELLFGEGKEWHRLREFRLRGLIKVNIERLITAAGQNIKRLLSRKTWKSMPDPAGVIALPALFSISSC
jgi:hypothetical protein